MDTNEQIKHIRTQHDMTQNEFAASLGISRSALTQLEAGHTKPSFDLLQKLIDQYDVDVNVFFNSSVRSLSNSCKRWGLRWIKKTLVPNRA